MNAGVATTGRRSREAGERVRAPVPQWDQPRAANRWPRRGPAGSRLSTSMPDHPTSLSVAAGAGFPDPGVALIPGERRRSIHMKTPIATVTSRAEKFHARRLSVP